MKLLRWTLAGAGAYVVYKYSIGRKAKGDDVFESLDKALETAPAGAGIARRKIPASPKRPARAAKKGR